MSGGEPSAVYRDVGALFGAGTAAGLSDGQLLERFRKGRDAASEAAFSALMGRHGPMVWGVCRRALDDPNDAADAFQATFLVLVRKASDIREDSLGRWLYGVSRKVAARARATSARRSARETGGVEAVAATAQDPDPDRAERLEAIDEAIARLPEKYRAAVVLCDLEGMPHEAAARQLGCALGTVESRLSRGRARLRERLIRRGFAPSAARAGALLSAATTSAAVPKALLDSTTRIATRVAAGGAVAAGVTPTTAALTEGVLRMMFRTRLNAIMAAILAVGTLTSGLGVLVHRTVGAPPQEGRAGEAAKEPPASKTPNATAPANSEWGEILAFGADISREAPPDGSAGMIAIDPETAKWRPITKGLSQGPLSPDGRFFVYSRVGQGLEKDEEGFWVEDLKGQTPPRRVFEQKGVVSWWPDGRQVVITTPVGGQWNEGVYESWRIAIDGPSRTKLPIPDTDMVLDCSRDGSWLATRTDRASTGHRGRITLVHPDGTGVRHITEGSAKGDLLSICRFSPDGRTLAYVEFSPRNPQAKPRLYLIDVEGKSRRPLSTPFEPDTIVNIAWSPDGTRLALGLMSGRTKQGTILLTDLDGKVLRTFALSTLSHLKLHDWRPGTTTLAAVSPRRILEEPSAEATSSPSRARYRALLAEHSRAWQEFTELRQKAKTDEERGRIIREKTPQAQPYVTRFLEIAESSPEDRAAVDSLAWVIEHGFDGPEFDRAIDLMAGRHAGEPKAFQTAMGLGYSTSPTAEKLFRAVLEKAASRGIKGQVCLVLGRYLKHQSEKVQDLEDDPDTAKGWENLYLAQGADKSAFARFRGRDSKALMRGAVAVFERAIAEFDDVPAGGGSTAGKEARLELDEIRNLQVGKPAPEISGRDVDDRPFSLSDYRGKVVVIDFWATWCGSCRGMSPLAKRMEGKPFALLGVNSDDDKTKLRDRLKADGITWRSWCDGGDVNHPGPIAERFNIFTRPTIYVLDPQGVIRAKFLGSVAPKRLDAIVDALVAEADKAAASNR